MVGGLGGRFLAEEQVLVGDFPIRRRTDKRSRPRRATDERSRIRRGTNRSAWPRLGGHGQLRLLDLLEQHRERAVENYARIAVGNLATEKSLQPTELLVGLLADGELHTVARGRRGLDDRAGGRRQRRGRRGDRGARRARRAVHRPPGSKIRPRMGGRVRHRPGHKARLRPGHSARRRPRRRVRRGPGRGVRREPERSARREPERNARGELSPSAWRPTRKRYRRLSYRGTTRDLSHGAREVGPRRQLGNQGFDLTSPPAPCSCEDRLVVLRREVRCQQADGGQAQGAGSQQIEDQREAPAGPSGVDTVAGGILGEPKGLGAIAEERAVALSGVEHLASVERGQVGHQLG
jgi:hypothetical protein